MTAEIPIDVDRCWEQLISLANRAQTDPRDAAAGIVQSLMAQGNPAHISQLRHLVDRELAVQYGAPVPLSALQLQSVWLATLVAAQNTLTR